MIMGMRRFIVVIFICLGSLTAFGQQMTFGEKLSDAALLLTKERVVYDPAMCGSTIRRMEMRLPAEAYVPMS